MTMSASFIRKVIYIALMALLLIPLSYLSQPSGVNVAEHPGGMLDQMRREHDLSLSSLGEVDPTSETMKLATLGMRGVACAILWNQRDEYKKKENWDAYSAVNNQIAKLQPHFISVWTFQSWDESYNVSVEFDDYRMRYRWVKKGIDHIIEGTRYNRRSPKLMTDLAWVFGHKFGRSDEKVQFRRAFKRDDDFHNTLPLDLDDPNVEIRDKFVTELEDGKKVRLIDNWLVGREFYLQSIRIAESPGASRELLLRHASDRIDPTRRIGQSKVIFYSNPAMQSMNYAEAVEEDGQFGQPASNAWRDAGIEWDEYGQRVIPTSMEHINIRLNDLETLRGDAAELRNQLDELAADAREDLRKKKLRELPAQERDAFNKPADERDPDEQVLAAAAARKIEVTHQEAAQNASADVKDKAFRLAARLTDMEQHIRFINSYRNIVNFEYWRTRAEAEQKPIMVQAKELIFQAKDLRQRTILTRHIVDLNTGETEPGAKESYRRAFKNFSRVFREYPIMIDNPETEDLVEEIKNYREVLSNLDEEIPTNFSLQVLVDMYDSNGHKRPNADEVVELWLDVRRHRPHMPKPYLGPRDAVPSPPQVREATSTDMTAGNDGEGDADPRSQSPQPPVVPDDVE